MCVLLSLIGLGLCAYLTVIHVALLRGELIGGAACSAAGSAFNCHAVTASPFGSFLGVPLSLWGALGYLATLALGFIAWQFSDWTPKALSVLAALALAFVLADLGMLLVMVFVIRYLCPLCLATYGVNLLLLAIAKRASQQGWGPLLGSLASALGAFLPKPRAPVVWIFWGVVLAGAGGLFATHATATYLTQGAPGAMHQQLMQFVSQQKRVTVDTTGDPRRRFRRCDGPPAGSRAPPKDSPANRRWRWAAPGPRPSAA